MAAATLVAQRTAVGLQLSRGHINAAGFDLVVFKSGLLIAVTYFYLRHRWPAERLCMNQRLVGTL